MIKRILDFQDKVTLLFLAALIYGCKNENEISMGDTVETGGDFIDAAEIFYEIPGEDFLSDEGHFLEQVEELHDFSVEEEKDFLEEEICQPECADKECGDDGCGSICGFCPYGSICKAFKCIEVCVPDCTDKLCGNDGCGGLCGDCPEGKHCGEDFTCVDDGCIPNCGGKECGADGCGGYCGFCADGYICVGAGVCQIDTSCGNVTESGECKENILLYCNDNTLQKEQCDAANGYVCGLNKQTGKYGCVKPEECVPQCGVKECGGDGCGGSCGQCGEMQVCSQYFKCGEPCGDITETGKCEGSTLKFCHGGIIVSYNCAGDGKKCKWDPTGNAGQGWYDCL